MHVHGCHRCWDLKRRREEANMVHTLRTYSLADGVVYCWSIFYGSDFCSAPCVHVSSGLPTIVSRVQLVVKRLAKLQLRQQTRWEVLGLDMGLARRM